MRIFSNHSPAKRWAFSTIIENLKSEIPEMELIGKPDNSTVNLIMAVSGIKRNDINLKNTIVRIGSLREMQNKDQALLECLKRVWGVIALSDTLLELALRHNRNSRLIPNGLDLRKWSLIRNGNMSRSRLSVGFAANISTPDKRAHKGFDYVLEACRLLNCDLVTALYLENQIDNDRMMDCFYHKIDVFVLPTLSEGCSNAIMEALACGVPVITTKCVGYHGERLKDYDNVLFCERSADSVATCIDALIKKPNMRKDIGIRGRIFAESNHDIRIIAAEYADMFSEIGKNCNINDDRRLEIREALLKLKNDLDKILETLQ